MSISERRTFIALGIAVAICGALPAGLADRFTTFDYSDESTPTSFGNFQAKHEVQPGLGLMNLYASATASGGVDVVGRIGATYTLNDGDLLAPFGAFTSVSGTAVGELTCLNLNPQTEASLTLTLQKWHEVAETWNLEQTAFVDEWRCPLVTLVNYEPFVGGATFSYDPGETYRLVVEAVAQSRAANGSQAITDFCDSDAFACGALGIPGHLLFDFIDIPNQRPIAFFQDTETWFVDAILNGAVITGRACDIDGTVADIKVWVSELITTTVTPLDAICGDGQHIVIVSAPGTFTGNAEARDDEGDVGRDVGVFRVTLLPPLQSMGGIPELASVAPRSLVVLETWGPSAGTLEDYRLTVDELLVADTTRDEPTGHHAIVTFDLVNAHAAVVLDGQERWSGPVTPRLGAVGWWDIEPVAVPLLARL